MDLLLEQAEQIQGEEEGAQMEEVEGVEEAQEVKPSVFRSKLVPLPSLEGQLPEVADKHRTWYAKFQSEVLSKDNIPAMIFERLSHAPVYDKFS